MPLSKINVPLDTPVTAGQSNNNYYGEVAKIQELAANLNRTTTGQTTWTSESSGITYNTSSYSSQSTIYNKGETGLLNLLIYLYGTDPSLQAKRFIMTADDWNEVNDILTSYGDGALAVAKASKIATNAAIGSSTQPVYVTSNGTVTACTSYANATVGYANEATTASKLGSTDVGSNTTPIWIDDGVAKACTAVAAATATTATTATKLGSTNLGTSTKPIYLVGGVPTECTDFSASSAASAGTANTLATARNLKVDLASNVAASFNGSADVLNIGVSSVLPRANGGTGTDTAQGSATKPVYLGSSGIAPCTYSLSATVNSGTASKIAYYSGTNAVSALSGTTGSATQPIYLNAGVPTACTNTIAAGTSAGTSGKLAYYSGANQIGSYTSTVGASNRMVYLNAGVPTAGIKVSYGSTLPSSGMVAGDVFIKTS